MSDVEAWSDHAKGRRSAIAADIVMQRLQVGTSAIDYRLQSQSAAQNIGVSTLPAPAKDKEPSALSRDQQGPVDKMAYRVHQGEIKDGQTQRSEVFSANMTRFQSDDGAGHRARRPMQASDLKSDKDAHHKGTYSGLRHNQALHFQDEAADSKPKYLSTVSETRSSQISYVPSAQAQALTTCDSTNAAYSPTLSGQASSDQIKEVQHTPAGTHTPLFDNLPDPIRLSEQTGGFDGQVIFIGHPNRDISAHQWSSASFQWVNIGRYARSRGKVEGSLASDRLRGIEEPQDTLEYFKLAAESRQTLILEHGRPKIRSVTEEGGPCVGVDIFATSQKREHPPVSNLRLFPPGLALPSSAASSLQKDTLEDPFITEASRTTSQPTDSRNTQGNWTGSVGSLDLSYHFPIKTINPTQHPVGEYSFFGVKSTENSGLGGVFAPCVQEVAGEEDENHQESFAPKDRSFQPLRASTGYQRFLERAQLLSIKEESILCTAGTKIQDTVVQQTLSKRPFALETSTSSALNAAAVPYTRKLTTGANPGASESYTGGVNTAQVGLHYSDPDGLRTTQQHEVANGLSQQPPTPQTFQGPFFTESKPTTHDPTAALSVRVDEEEKLVNWFRDGHRPARQKEYTKSLIAAAAANDARRLGSTGRTSTQGGGSPYANTGPFVRLYENISEYVEEYRNGSGRSYFTRGWKPANSQLRETSVNSSASYFSKRGAHSRWPNVEQVSRPSGRSIWD